MHRRRPGPCQRHEALERGDPAPELCDPEIQITNWAESPVTGPYHGHEGLRRIDLDFAWGAIVTSHSRPR